MSVEVKEVTLYATVRDKKGKIIGDLKKDNFKLNEDGRPQNITYFAQESDLPLTIGLLVDTSLSQRRVLDDERGASGDFLDDLLREDKDKAFLVHFDREVELLQDLTSSREKLRASLQLLETPSLEEHASGGHSHGGGTLLYDAIYLAGNEIMSKQQGRKALIILTDGVDVGSKETIGSAIEAVQRADTSVFSILFADENAYGGGGPGGGWGGRGGWPGGSGGGPGGGRGRSPQERPDGKKVLERIAKETGGEFFQITKKLSIEQVYAEIQQGLRNQYSLGYTPDRANEATFHKIQVTVNQKDLTVRARDSYYSGT